MDQLKKAKVERRIFIIVEHYWQSSSSLKGQQYSYRKEKKTHELIFSWLS